MRLVGLLTLAGGLALAGGWLGSGSGASIPGARFARGAHCARRSGLMPRLAPATGPPGTTVTLTGALPPWGGQSEVSRPAARVLEVWWNLSPSIWLTVRGGEPAPPTAHPGPAQRELRAAVPRATACAYQLVFRVPHVAAGEYPVDLLYRTAAGAANLPAVAFTVTK